MDKSDNLSNRDDPTGGTGPQESSGAMRKWLDSFFTPGEAGSEPPADPIARNPKDAAQSGEAVQAMEEGSQTRHTAFGVPVRHRREAAVPAEGLARLSGFAGGFHPHPAPSAADLLASVLRFKWTVLVVWILVSAPIIAAVWTQILPQYQARAEVQVRPIVPRLVFKTDENGQVPFYDSFVNTQVSLIRNTRILQNVLDRKEIQQTRWYQGPPPTFLNRVRGGPTDRLERLWNALSVRPRPRTEIIDVSFMDVSADEAKKIVNAVVEEYLTWIGTAADEDERKIDGQLAEQYKTLDGDIRKLETQRTDLCKMLQTDSPQELIAGKRVRLDENRARLNALKFTIDVLGREVNNVKQTAIHDSNSTPAASAEGKPEYSEDAEWRKLDLDVKRLQHQMENSVRKPKHPGWGRDANDLEFARMLLQERQAQLDKQWQDRSKNAVLPTFAATAASTGYDTTLGSPPQRLAKAQQDAKALVASLTQEETDFQKLFKAAQDLEVVSADLQHKREMFDAVRQRIDQRNVEHVAPGSIKRLSSATSLSKPAQDRRVVFTIMALFTGLGLGGGAGFLRASRNQMIYAPRDMPQPARVPLLGCMPLIHLDKPVGEALSKEIEQKQGALIESVRVLRTALLTRLDGHGHTTVVVTSANRGTGKSSVTLVLGKSIAQAGRKVLLIDADFRRMGLSKRLNMANKPGFRESLKDGTAENLHVFSTGTAGLDVMPAGLRGRDNNVFDEIAHDAFKRWLGQLFERYGYQIVLLDTPPLLPVADATILAGQADATILVEREHVSRRAEIESALLLLGSAGGRLLGTVFVGSTNDDRYGYGYGYYGSSAREP